MVDPNLRPETPELLLSIYRLFRDYFDQAEKKRRWSLREDIPWDQCNPAISEAVADLVETFCAVEMFLPDYLAKTIPGVRQIRGRAWFFANWGYEESKHSMALEDWLARSGKRSEEQLADLHSEVVRQEWQLPYDNTRYMVCYTLIQELATWLHYVRLRKIVHNQGGCPALERVLTLVSVDERAHFEFFRKLALLYLEHDREGTLFTLREVVNQFQMPAVHLLTDSKRRIQAVRDLNIFDEHVYLEHVVQPMLDRLGLTRADLRRKARRSFSPNGLSN
ncbi:MAG: acyl-ACP desaturase [Gemmataceae bacterium]